MNCLADTGVCAVFYNSFEPIRIKDQNDLFYKMVLNTAAANSGVGFLSWVSSPGFPLLGFLSWVSSPGVPLLRFLSWGSSHGVPLLGFFSWGSSAEVPLLGFLSWGSSPMFSRGTFSEKSDVRMDPGDTTPPAQMSAASSP